jgi:carbonic anhydrase/acetyltransferase-like protein (isoleucine patch superfamily)
MVVLHTVSNRLKQEETIMPSCQNTVTQFHPGHDVSVPRQTKRARRALAAAVLALLGPVASQGALAASCTWNPATGNWSLASAWSCGLVPTGSDIANIGAGKTVTVNSGQSIFTLNNAGLVDITAGFLRLQGPSISNTGSINIGQGSILAAEGNQTIGGGGNIVFADTNANNRLNLEAGNIVLAAGTTVRGNTGYIGQQVFIGGTTTLTNNGTISADVSGGTITLAVNGLTTNNGTLSAQNGGTLLLNSTITNSGTGQIVAGAGSTVVQNGITLNGTINVSGSGTFKPSNSGGNFLNAVTLAGNLDMASAVAIERVTGGLTLNTSTISIAQGSILAPQGSQSFSGNGNGTILFADNNANNRLNLEAGDLTLGAGVTVRGHTGYIGQQNFVGGTANLINNGNISADVAGGTITLAPNGITTNNGTLSAQNGGTLLLNSNVNNNPAGQIVVGVGSTVVQNGITLNGTINVSGSGTFKPSNSGGNFLNAVTLTGNLDMAGAVAIERVTGGLTLNASTISLAQGSILAPQGTQSFSGNGTILFADNNANNRLNLEAGDLTLGAGVTVRGHTGYIGQQNFVGGASNLINNGSISADVSGGTITLAPNGITTNNGTLSAQNGGTLLLNRDVTNNPGGQIIAGVGSTVVQNGVALNGVINVVGSGTFKPSNNGGNFLNAATLSGNLDMAAAVAIERVTGGLSLNAGTIKIGQGSILAPQGNQTISGTGSIVFADNNPNNRLNMEAGNLTLGAGVSVRGNTGYIGQQVFVGGTANLTNNGTISADSSGGVITVAPNGTFTNNGTLNTATGATIVLPTNFSNNGLMKGTGTFTVPGTLTNAGTVAPGASPGSLALTGNYAQAAAGTFAVELQSLAIHDLFNVSGTAAVGGTLALSCFGACSFNVGDVVTILDSVGDLSGSFASVTLNGFATGAFSVVYDTVNDKVDLLVTQAVSSVPEPSSYAMLLAGLGMVGWFAKRHGGQGARRA